jgi:hypothetical protein
LAKIKNVKKRGKNKRRQKAVYIYGFLYVYEVHQEKSFTENATTETINWPNKNISNMQNSSWYSIKAGTAQKASFSSAYFSGSFIC